MQTKEIPPIGEPVWPKLVAGGVSCMIISAALNPMDVIKVRLQLQNQLKSSHGLHLHTNAPYHGFLHAAARIFAEEGYFGGFMKGITASILRELSYSSLRMGLYDEVKSLISPNAGKNDFTLWNKVLAGALSGAIGSAFVNPTDLVKIRFQSVTPGTPKPYKNTFHAFYTIYRTEGMHGLYKGTLPTTIRASVLTSAQLSSYDHSKRFFLRHGYLNDDYTLHLTSSIISGLVTTTAANPVDIVKTRWMTDRSLYKSPMDVLIKTVRSEGMLALFKGWVPNYLRLGPHFLLSLPLNEYIRRQLGASSM
eukprot:TRINITY_DN12562_c0_g1_i1.p1 TRINITY_DN12562_c0_g1~~TRINITY_DN12562_c0_g1_i1.p1  ORF type:complete len:307 (-),score=35.96 TRINITY_DN12562_c0_g1_i1:12-932(-)